MNQALLKNNWAYSLRDYSAMNNNLKNIRQERALTQQQLADKLLVSRQTIISIENGRYDPSLPLAFKLAKNLGVSIEDIFKPD
jgi:putative transcriptional regulator